MGPTPHQTSVDLFETMLRARNDVVGRNTCCGCRPPLKDPSEAPSKDPFKGSVFLCLKDPFKGPFSFNVFVCLHVKCFNWFYNVFPARSFSDKIFPAIFVFDRVR